MTAALLLLFLASLGLDWPDLPGHARLAELLVVPAAVAVLLSGGRMLRWRLSDGAVVAYVALGAVGLVATSDMRASLVELARHAYLAGIYALVALAVCRGYARAVEVGLTATGAAPACAGLVFTLVFFAFGVDWPAGGEVMNLPYVGHLLRLRAWTASPTMFACVLVSALPFALAGWQRAATAAARWWWLVSGGVMAAAAVLTFSHAWAGLAVAVLVAMWPALASRPALRRAALAATVVVILAFNASLVASVRATSVGGRSVADASTYAYGIETRRVVIGPVTIDYAVMSYFRIKQLALETFAAHPLTGVGPDRFHDVTEEAYRAGRLPAGYRVIDPHSSLLGHLAETGLPGGISLLVLWAVMLRLGGRLSATAGPDRWLARAAFAGFAGLLVAGINVDIMNFRFVWAGLGVLRGLAEVEA